MHQSCEIEADNPANQQYYPTGASILRSVSTKVEGGWNRAEELERIKATYDRYATTDRYRLWDMESPGFARAVADVRRVLIRALHNSRVHTECTVLDLGCGTGTLLQLAEVDASKWTGVDLREEAIEAARSRFPGALFIQASADATPFDDGSFDIVVTQVLFSSLPSSNLESAVAREIQRLLRPGGWLVWSDIRYPNPSNPDVHGIPRERLKELFPGWQAELELVGLLPPLARRLGGHTPLLYPMLSILPALRSHLVGRLKRPVDARD